MSKKSSADVVKRMLLAGETADLSQPIERLSGYRRMTINEVKTIRGRQRPAKNAVKATKKKKK